MEDRQEAQIVKVLSYARRIAVVGLSDSARRISNQVSAMLQLQGYEIVPVNPTIETALGQRSYPSLEAVPGEIDLVNVFRRTEHLEDVAKAAVHAGARGIWNQLGLRSEAARQIAEDAGIDYVEDRCLKVEVGRHRDTLTLPPPGRTG